VDIAGEKYVSFTTFRRDGRPVSTPVWIAALADGRVGFTTDANVGKVKRLRNNPAVTLRPCNARGKVADGAPEVAGRGAIVTGAEYDQVWRAVRRKYPVIANVMHLGKKLRSVVRKSGETPTAILITLD
jgi:PPOX class probable F420-dependent enzyme